MPILAIASLVATQGAVTLLFQPKVGATYKYAMTQSTQSQMGNSSMTATNVQKILSVTGGLYKVQTTLNNVKMDGGMGASVKKAIEGKPSVMSIDKYGAIKFDASGSPGMQQMMGGMGGQSIGMQFPKKAVKVGESWTHTIDMGAMMGSMMKSQAKGADVKSSGKTTMTFKLVKIDGSSATINCSVSGTMSMDMKAPSGASGGPQQMKMTMSMNGSGQYSVERSTGMLQSSNMKTNINMGIMGQQMTTVQNISMKRI